VNTLIQKAKSGCNESFNRIVDQERKSINYHINRTYSDIHLRTDIEQLCYIGLLRAIKKYNFVNDFGKFAFNMIKSEVHNGVSLYNTAQKRTGRTIDIEEPISYDDNRHFINTISVTDNIEEKLDIKKKISIVYYKLKKEIDRKIFYYILKGYTVKEISKLIGFTKSNIRNRIDVIYKYYKSIDKDEQFMLKVRGVI